jgi:hypothetical protein
LGQQQLTSENEFRGMSVSMSQVLHSTARLLQYEMLQGEDGRRHCATAHLIQLFVVFSAFIKF